MGPWLLSVLNLAMASPQAGGATVAGIVRDESSGRPLVSALVTLGDLGRSIATDGAGRYEVPNVPPGPQHITIRSIGYAPRNLHALVPREGRLEINVSLRPDPYHLPAIEVRPPVAVRGLDDADDRTAPDRTVSMAALRNHPLLAEPDALQGLSGGEVVLEPESPDGLHVRGGSSDQTGYLLDGIPVFSPYHAAGLFSAWNPDALARVQLWSAAPSPAYPDVLSGTISGFTRSPGNRLQFMGSTSTTQARLAVDGPIGRSGVGFLLSVRQGFPGIIAPKDEASYLTGESGDWLLKLEGKLAGGTGGVLGYGSGDEIATSSVAGAPEDSPAAAARHSFEWNGGSLGGWWTRRLGRAWTARLSAWQARGLAAATWWQDSGRTTMGSTRRDRGGAAAVERTAGRTTTLLGIRAQWSRTLYDVLPAVNAEVHLTRTAPVVALFGLQTFAIGTPLTLTAGGALASYGGRIYPAPRFQARWTVSSRFAVTGSLARSHQFAQSLRNPESVVGNVFPADLYLGAGPGLPVARSDLAVLAADYRPASGFRAGVQAYARRFDGLVLVAPLEGGPFAVDDFALGSGHARGAALELALGTARTGVLASYGLQHTRYDHPNSSYAPDHGATHRLEGGFVVFPEATTSLRLGGVGLWGRRAALIQGGLEWESCNLLDRGCEFSGTPTADPASLGGELPAYFRMDLSARKHWHLEVAGRDASVALFATVTNLFGRRNLLARGVDPALDAALEVEMRPRAPLVLGLDWRF